MKFYRPFANNLFARAEWALSRSAIKNLPKSSRLCQDFMEVVNIPLPKFSF